MPTEPANVTRILRDARDGDSSAAARLLPLVYEELRGLAANLLRRGGPPLTLQPTALVHEAYLKLAVAPGETGSGVDWQDRAHFFAVAAKAMRQILIDHARGRGAAKRGGDWARVPLDQADGAGDDATIDLLVLNDALLRLAELDPIQSEVVALRFFSGMSPEEVALVMNISTRTVEREWRAARAWLRHTLEQGDSLGA